MPYPRTGLAALLLAAAACSRSTSPEPAPGSANAEPSSPPAPQPVTVFDAVRELEDCMLGHQGIVLDLGEPGTALRAGGRDDADGETIEREGATWTRVRGRSLVYRFVALDEGRTGGPAFVEARARGGAAKSASVYLNGKPVGTWSFGHDETRTVVARGGTGTLQPGENELLVRFPHVPARLADEMRAEIDWVHVGTGEPEPSFSAPTRADALASHTVGGTSKRGIALRAPGFARCTVYAPRGARLEVDVALLGGSEGEAEARWHRDRTEPTPLGRMSVQAKTGRWAHWSLPLPAGEGDGELGVIELSSRAAGKGARLFFGEPRVVVDAPPSAASPSPHVKSALLVVLGSTAPRSLAPYGGLRPVPELAGLAIQGAIFESHRAAAGFAAGALASMLTGRTPAQHGLIDPDARLPEKVTTLADAAHQAGIVTAFFTANPSTMAAFGFGRGWDTFVARPPSNEVPATRVFDELADWLAQQRDRRFLAVIHARGAHPPWDVSQDDLRKAPPPNYVGAVDPRNAAALFARSRRNGPRLTDADQTRLLALQALAVEAQDNALGRVLGALRAAGRDKDTLVLVTGDVGTNDTSPVPFAEGEPVDEPSLAVPLVVAAPGPALVGKRVRVPTSSRDVAMTLLGALGLTPPDGFEGQDLVTLARSGTAATTRPSLTLGARRSIARWGHLVYFAGHVGDEKLCDTILEPACLTDVQSTYPIALDALRRLLREGRRVDPTRPPPTREPATIDQATASALKAWGR